MSLLRSASFALAAALVVPLLPTRSSGDAPKPIAVPSTPVPLSVQPIQVGTKPVAQDTTPIKHDTAPLHHDPKPFDPSKPWSSSSTTPASTQAGGVPKLETPAVSYGGGEETVSFVIPKGSVVTRAPALTASGRISLRFAPAELADKSIVTRVPYPKARFVRAVSLARDGNGVEALIELTPGVVFSTDYESSPSKRVVVKVTLPATPATSASAKSK